VRGSQRQIQRTRLVPRDDRGTLVADSPRTISAVPSCNAPFRAHTTVLLLVLCAEAHHGVRLEALVEARCLVSLRCVRSHFCHDLTSLLLRLWRV
jgi:hypothetical protein